MSELAKLLTHIEALSGPDRETDRDLWEALTGECTHRNTHYVELENDERELECSDCGADTYGADKWSGLTNKVEAAVAMIDRCLPGCGWSVDRRVNGSCWGQIEQGDEYWTYAGWPPARAATPTLALLAALVRAVLSRADSPIPATTRTRNE